MEISHIQVVYSSVFKFCFKQVLVALHVRTQYTHNHRQSRNVLHRRHWSDCFVDTPLATRVLEGQNNVLPDRLNPTLNEPQKSRFLGENKGYTQRLYRFTSHELHMRQFLCVGFGGTAYIQYTKKKWQYWIDNRRFITYKLVLKDLIKG